MSTSAVVIAGLDSAPDPGLTAAGAATPSPDPAAGTGAFGARPPCTAAETAATVVAEMDGPADGVGASTRTTIRVGSGLGVVWGVDVAGAIPAIASAVTGAGAARVETPVTMGWVVTCGTAPTVAGAGFAADETFAAGVTVAATGGGIATVGEGDGAVATGVGEGSSNIDAGKGVGVGGATMGVGVGAATMGVAVGGATVGVAVAGWASPLTTIVPA